MGFWEQAAFSPAFSELPTVWTTWMIVGESISAENGFEITSAGRSLAVAKLIKLPLHPHTAAPLLAASSIRSAIPSFESLAGTRQLIKYQGGPK